MRTIRSKPMEDMNCEYWSIANDLAGSISTAESVLRALQS